MNNKKIAIIGCGNLGLSILNGLLSEGIPASNIIATRRNIDSLNHLKDAGITLTSDNVTAIRDSELIIVALKPYTILEVLSTLREEFKPERHILVSLATGISLNQISERIDKPIPIFRAMPNTGADVGMSMTCISGKSNSPESETLVKECFNSIGETIMIDENLMDAATVLGACGIAYVLRFIRAMIQGGVQIGFDAKTATEIVTHTVQGAAELLIKNGEHPEFEIDKVTTPKGCTIAGLNEMEHNGMSSALIKGIVTSYDIIEK
ncbi:MAG: pyrroline-5-carboxylate reductase [Crocinitomicaceae bacterium]